MFSNKRCIAWCLSYLPLGINVFPWHAPRHAKYIPFVFARLPLARSERYKLKAN